VALRIIFVALSVTLAFVLVFAAVKTAKRLSSAAPPLLRARLIRKPLPAVISRYRLL
jgi:hypothetical protein